MVMMGSHLFAYIHTDSLYWWYIREYAGLAVGKVDYSFGVETEGGSQRIKQLHFCCGELKLRCSSQ